MAGGVLTFLAIGVWLLGVWAQGTGQRAEAGLASLTNSMMVWDSVVRANSWGGQRFEWTRPLVFTSSIEPTLGWGTNRLSQ